MAGDHRDDPLAYGDYYQGGRGAQGHSGDENYQEGERGLIGDTFRKLHSFYKPQQQDQNTPPPLHGSAPNAPPISSGGPQPSSGAGSSLFDKLHGAVHGLGSELNQRLSGRYNAIPPSSGLVGSVGTATSQNASQHRYGSFAGTKLGNDAKWYVDGCGYMWAVSRALEQAQESIWILDCKKPSYFLRGFITLEYGHCVFDNTEVSVNCFRASP